jgi:hypothetical protein
MSIDEWGRSQTSRHIRQETTRPRLNGRIACECCGHTVNPRLVTYYGTPLHSLCPVCGSVIRRFSEVVTLGGELAQASSNLWHEIGLMTYRLLLDLSAGFYAIGGWLSRKGKRND